MKFSVRIFETYWSEDRIDETLTVRAEDHEEALQKATRRIFSRAGGSQNSFFWSDTVKNGPDRHYHGCVGRAMGDNTTNILHDNMAAWVEPVAMSAHS